MHSLHDALTGSPYPGRGVLWCRTRGGDHVGAYFLTGRSEASRARALRHGPAGDLMVVPAKQQEHDRLRHYTAVCQSDDWLVFGNGEQVSTVAARLRTGLCPPLALDGLDYEPDPPIFTPRLTVIAHPAGRAWFGAARHSATGRTATNRLFLEIDDLQPGEAVLVTTYHSDGEIIRTGAPFLEVRTNATGPLELLNEVWSVLSPQFRVAAAVFAPFKLADAGIRHASG